MAGFIKNRARKKLLELAFKGRHQGNGQQELKPVFPDVKRMKSMGILFKMDNQGDIRYLEELVSWAAGKGCAACIVAVETEKCFKDDIQRNSFMEELGGRCSGSGVQVCFVGKKELDSFGVPQAGKLDSFLQQKLDILVSLNDNGNFTLDYLALKADAAFVVGIEYRDNGYYDMVLTPGTGMPAPAEYMQQLFDYLEKMNCNGE